MTWEMPGTTFRCASPAPGTPFCPLEARRRKPLTPERWSTPWEVRDELSRWIARLFSCQVWTGFVDRDHPEMELPFSK